MADRPSETGPLLSTAPLVREDGTGSDYFLRQWSLQREVNSFVEDTAVTPGSYTNTNLTVDQQGRITAASNGATVPLVNKASSEVTGELTISAQTEIATVNITKGDAASAISLKLNYQALNGPVMWSDASIQFSRTDILFDGVNADTAPELIVKSDAVQVGISNFVETGVLYATKFVEVIIPGLAAGARTISVDLKPNSSVLVKNRRITVLEL